MARRQICVVIDGKLIKDVRKRCIDLDKNISDIIEEQLVKWLKAGGKD